MSTGKVIRKRNMIMSIIFLFPATILYIPLFIYPSVKAFYISLFDWNGFTSDMRFIGLGNFKELFFDEKFWRVAMKNTILIIMVGGALIFTVAFILSGVLSTRIKGKRFLRGIIFFPVIINPIAIAILWSFIYNYQWGLLNTFLKVAGLGILQQTWMSAHNLFWSILVALVWMYSGFYCIILLAAFDNIPPSHIEVAYLEGANELAIFFRIKIPLIWDVLITSLTLWGITAVKEFSLLFAWGGGVDIPADGVTNLAVQMFVTAFGKRVTIYRMGYSTSMGIMMFLIIAAIVLTISLLARREKVEY